MTAWKKDKMPVRRGWAGVAEYGGRLYWTGGDTPDGIPSGEVWSCNAKGDKQRHEDMPVAVSWHGCAVLGGKLYCVGGRDASGATSAVQVFDLATGRWSLDAPLPSAVWQHSLAGLYDGILCAGGVREGKTLSETLYFKPSAGKWSRLCALSEPRRGHSCLNLGGQIYCVGGSTAERLRPIAAMERLSSPDSAWSPCGEAPSPRWLCGDTVIGGVLYHAGADNRLHLYNPGDKSWSPSVAIPPAAVGGRLLALEGKLLLDNGKGGLWR